MKSPHREYQDFNKAKTPAMLNFVHFNEDNRASLGYSKCPHKIDLVSAHARTYACSHTRTHTHTHTHTDTCTRTRTLHAHTHTAEQDEYGIVKTRADLCCTEELKKQGACDTVGKVTLWSVSRMIQLEIVWAVSRYFSKRSGRGGCQLVVAIVVPPRLHHKFKKRKRRRNRTHLR